MNRITALLVCLFVVVIVNFSDAAIFSGNDSLKKITVTDVHFGVVTPYTQFGNISVNEVRRLTARSYLLQTDLTGYSYNCYREVEASRVDFGFSLGNYLKKDEKYTYRINFGLSFNSANPVIGNFTRTDTIPYDTLTSSQTGNVIYVKKLTTNTYDIYYYSNRICFDINAVVSTSPLKRFSFYAGLGIVYGMGLSASTEINYMKYYGYTPDIYDNNWEMQTEAEFTNESLENSTGYSLGFYVPIGMQFRFGKQAKFWKRFYMYYEFVMGMNSEYIPELGQYTGFYPGMRCGWKYYIGKLE